MPLFLKRKRSGSMPASKRARVTTRVPTFRSRRRRRYGKNRRNKNGVYTKLMRMPVPDRMLTKLRYCEFFDLSPTAAGSPGMVSYSFRNSIFDPNYTGLGHQPLWHDTLFLMYGQYRVLGMKYKFIVMNSNTNQLGTIVIEHANGPPQVAATGITTIMERRACRTFNVNSSASNPIIIKGYMPVGKPYGLNKTDFMADVGFECAMGQNPSKASHVNVYAVTQNSTAIFNIQATVEYYVEFTNRILTGQS